ncbi:DUF523 and DUF1722 domain-containing protein [Salinactinospora qingdaonensis]|uniref:DUF523 and DUF1722 domain-containing protein n=1 Tax=Salinactinospora qingdaonensis TaxID=702744 RepID=A0ABP7GBW0_9ACTN
MLGEPVRYNGGHCRNRFLTDVLGRHVEWVAICPEAEIGLGTPRETLRLERTDAPSGAQPRVRATKSGTDHTDAIRNVADAHLAVLRTLDGYVLKNKSPSCGLFGLPVFEEGKRVDGKGRGGFAARLLDLCPELPAEEEGRLTDADLCEHFVERVFAHARLRALLESAWRPRDLIDFHARHKLQLLSHSPQGARSLGRIVTEAGTGERSDIAADYTAAFHSVLATPTSPGKHVNALQHAFGMVSGYLDDSRRHDILAAIDDYRAGHVPLTLPLSLIRHHCNAERVAWASQQTYLAPFPTDLGLRNQLPRK